MRRCVSVVAVLLMVAVGSVPAIARPTASAAGQSAGRSAAGAPASAAAAEVERVERELVAAIAKGDLAAYDRIVADDYVAYTVTGQEVTKPEIMASYREGTRKYMSLSISDVKVRVFGETAILSARTTGTRIEEGSTPVPNVVRYFRVFTRRAGAWRAVMQMVTPLPAETGAR
jgi:ketosteroid isomerase-like protein